MYRSKIKSNNNYIRPLVFLTICLLSAVTFTQAQIKSIEDIRATIDVKDEPLNKVLAEIEQQTSFRFAYNSDFILRQKNVTLSVSNMKISELLNALFKRRSITYRIIGNQVILQKPASRKITVRGYVRDMSSGETLIGASVYLPVFTSGAVTNPYGFYSLTVPVSDSLKIAVSYIGYKPARIIINGRRDTLLNINLTVKKIAINPVRVVKNKSDDYVKENQISRINMTNDMMTSSVALTGNGDLINSVQLSTGVQAEFDGTGGYYVRGGNADQNRVLLDGAAIYNPSHLFGLVSIFNTSAIKRASFMKGGFPAAYGDNLSSVLDVDMNDGSNHQFGGKLLLGNIASSIELNGPIVSDKSSFLLAARRSAIDWTLSPFFENNYFSNYYFYDINGKVNFQLSNKDRLYISYYRGSDKNSYLSEGPESDMENDNDADKDEDIDYRIAFGNQTVNLRWNHLFSAKLFSNVSAIYSNYYQRLSSIQGGYFAELYSGIRDIDFKADFYYYPNIKHRVRGGIDFLFQSLFPATVSNKLSSTGFVNISQHNIPEKRQNRFAAYISDDIRINDHLKAYAGVRFPVFFKPGLTYMNIEPRLSLLYLLGNNSSIKLAYSGMHQYLHLVQSYNASFPAEIWIGSRLVKPEYSRQVSSGIYKSITNNTFQAGLEVYYKYMGNQMLFKGETSPTINNNIENQLIFGEGWSYGTEFSINKTKGNFTGRISYSFTQAYQKFDALNHGLKFPFAHNRKHNFYFTGSYNINNHWTVVANLFLTSGGAITLDQGTSSAPPPGNQDDNPIYEDEDDDEADISIDPNNFRLTSYSRLDLSISYKKIRQAKNRQWESEWKLSVYNAYAHRNTYFAYRSIDPVTRKAYINQVSFIPVIPSLTYSLGF